MRIFLWIVYVIVLLGFGSVAFRNINALLSEYGDTNTVGAVMAVILFASWLIFIPRLIRRILRSRFGIRRGVGTILSGALAQQMANEEQRRNEELQRSLQKSKEGLQNSKQKVEEMRQKQVEHTTSETPASAATNDTLPVDKTKKLKELEQLFYSRLITKEEYDAARARLME